MLRIDPIEPTLAIEPMHATDPIDAMQPAEPIDPIEPELPIEPMDPADPMDPIEPAEPIDPIEPALPIEALPADGTVPPPIDDTDPNRLPRSTPLILRSSQPSSTPWPERKPAGTKAGRCWPASGWLPVAGR
jgi:hypothetical protein